jgi:peptide chain release factor 1
LEETPGFASFLVRGEGAEEFFNETGGHRWQRIPPTEHRGRVHTSTVTVAALAIRAASIYMDPNDVEIQTTRGSGPGGQNRNKVESCVLAIHRPTGLSVRIDGRSQLNNKKIALQILATKLEDQHSEQQQETTNRDRKDQVGSGQRGDKIRTYRVRDNIVIDHRTGQKCQLSRWLDGVREL